MNNRISTAPHKPAATVIPRDALVGTRTPPQRQWGVRRRALVASIVAVLLVLLVAGFYAWRILSALLDSQGSAVVPLPTRSSGIAVLRSPTATPEPDETAKPTPNPRPTGAGAVDATPPPEATTLDQRATPMQTPDAPNPSPVTVEATATVSAVTDNVPLETSADLSRLDIAQAVVSASIQNGDPATSSVWQGKTALNILVLGVDRRPDGGDQNSDVIIIAEVALDTGRVSAVSLPRDLYVDVPGLYTGKINGAYNTGVGTAPDDRTAGVVLVRDTIEALYGIPIDAYVLIDFNGFQAVIDAVGGVDLTVPAAIVDEAYPTIDYGTERVEFKAGYQHMDGERALKYVRTRNTDSDDARRDRQIDVLLALFDQGKSLESIRGADEIIFALMDTIQTNLGLEQQLMLARIAREMDRDDITLTTLGPPLITGGPNAEGAWVYSSDPVAVAAFIAEALETGTAPTPGS